MTQPGTFTPYSTVPWKTTPASWVPAIDQERINSYQVYEELYWSHINTTYKVMSRDDSEEKPIYVPASRIIVDAVNRYVGNGLAYQADPTTGSPASRQLAMETFKALFARERFASQYDANKRYGLIRGDWAWHILADPNKVEGARISILPVDPASMFKVFESDRIPGGSPDKLVCVYLVDRVLSGDTYVIRRQRYERVQQPDGSYTIWSELAVFEEDKWFTEGEQAGEKAMQILQPLTALPPEITSIPVYHIQNTFEPTNPYGSSELRGLETVAAGINQSVTDEDLALALMGLGVYATDSPGSPIDPVTGEPRNWFIYPGAVIENSKGLRKVEGVSSVAAYTEHIGRLFGFLQQASGAVNAAIGRVDVQVAESGVALMLELAPMLAKAVEKDRIILDIHGHMYYDLRSWLKVYEGINIDDVIVVPVLGDKVPVNRKAEVELVTMLMSTVPPVLSAESARRYLISKGFTGLFSETEGDLVTAETAANVAANTPADLLAERTAQESAGIGSDADAGGSTGAEG